MRVTQRSEVIPAVRSGAHTSGAGAHRFPRRAGRLGLPDGSGRSRFARHDPPSSRRSIETGGGRDSEVKAYADIPLSFTLRTSRACLTRVASLFRRRAFNIESLTVGHTEKPGVSRMTIVVDTDELGARRLEAHLYKLVNVLRSRTSPTSASVVRDLALIKVGANADRVRRSCSWRRSSARAWSTWRHESIIIEITGTEDKIDGLLEVLAPYGILEMVRTGRVAMARGIEASTPAIVTANGSKVAAVYEEEHGVSYSV